MKSLIIFCFSALINISYSGDQLPIPSTGENSGQNKYERLGGVEKQMITLFEAQNESRREQQEFLTQLTNLKKDLQKLSGEKEQLTKDNSELRREIANLKKNISEITTSLNQIRTSVYGEEGKKEKDELLQKK